MIKKIIFGLVSTFFVGVVSAATVDIITVGSYSAFENYTDCTTSVPCQNFQNTHGVSGTFTTDGPLPINIQGNTVDITASVTSWRFSNGLDVFSSTDPQARLTGLSVTTDISGNVTSIFMHANLWLTGFEPHTTADRYSYVSIDTDNHGYGAYNVRCAVISDQEDDCDESATDALSAAPVSSGSGSLVRFQTRASASPHPVPTLSEWGLVVMAILLGLFGVFYLSKTQKIVRY